MEQPSKSHNSVATALIAVGSNQISPYGCPIMSVKEAFRAIERAEIQIQAKSRLFNTPCFPAGAGPDYVNAALRITTTLPPLALLQALHEVESDFDRERTNRWAARTLDLDLIDHGGALLPDRATWDHWHNMPLEQQKTTTPQGLITPHPRVQDRAFVLVPLADVAPDWTHPVTGATINQMLAALPKGDIAAITPLEQGI
ncbi:2-amino-4-hydroxy-6-hydroxymethyldihydropteridine diphosphokinase [Alphaproteobacteria bacterium KMM 3653]|uniref:2-amino-4-hydroxy-6-hydroxymethyldihydropteridine pyrophosphokinase n=1 Tax=Harenicola maris TaxID=2841044 RepID=A0AAP2G9P3_9RHOB|nr:2-amino-4-hydroxy-6-hydroxymethyldihydropteridine diphosphokinase [Harenicola maris]